jgi:acyl dehydratase
MSRYDDLLRFAFPEVEHTYTERDTILYALGVGAAQNPLDPQELRFVYEKNLLVLPSMAVTLAYPGFWYRDLKPGLDFVKTVHGSERFEIHQPLPAAATVVATPKIVAIHDKGEGRGALIVSERVIYDKPSGERLATVSQTAFCRGDGGLGGPMLTPPAPHQVPARDPDRVVEIPTSRQAAAVYRLSGDYNPLHIEPDFANRAGFERPILHGLSTYGHVCRALTNLFAGQTGALRDMDCRFTAAVYPGDVLSLNIWEHKDGLSFRAAANGRTVVDNGVAHF